MKNLQFTIESGNKNTVIRFNDSKSFHTVGENAPWESIPFMNAITHIMNQANPAYEVMEPGMYLHKSLEKVVDMLKNSNVGYASHVVVNEMAEAGLLRRDLEIKPGVYRLMWNGLFLTASDMPYRQYVEGENAQVSHNRDAFRLFMAFETIRKAAEQGKNIRLLTVAKQQPRVDLFMKHYGLFLAGKFDELAESVKAGIAKAATRETMQYYSNRSAAALAKGNAFEAPEKVGDFAVADLLGKRIQFVSGNTTLPIEWTVTDAPSNVNESIISVGDLAATLKERNLKIHVVNSAPAAAEVKAEKVARKPRKAAVNVPTHITE